MSWHYTLFLVERIGLELVICIVETLGCDVVVTHPRLSLYFRGWGEWLLSFVMHTL